MTAHEVRALRGAMAPRSTSTPGVAAWAGYRPAAVLVPLLPGPRGLEVLFTVRSAHLSSHAGQISFPGGRIEAGESVEEAAAREAREEVGLEVPAEALLGRLTPRPSPARYLATPVVALLDAAPTLVVEAGEVEEAFTVPLATLAGTAPTWERRTLEGRRLEIVHYRVEGRHIWGLTGTVLHELLAIVGNAARPA